MSTTVDTSQGSMILTIDEAAAYLARDCCTDR